jgi:hypothetical protein
MAIFRDFLSSVRVLLEQHERRTSEADPGANERNHLEEIAALRQIADRLQAISSQQNSEHQRNERRYWRWSVVIQILLFIATASAFGAAYWYARIADQQKNTMITQATATNSTLQEIQKQTPLIRQGADGSTKAADAARRSANIARDALTSAQRAFVIFGKNMQENAVIVAGPPTQITQWEFRPHIENSGSTPTRNAQNHANFLPAVSLPDNFQFPDYGNEVADSRFVLGPKESATGALLAVPLQNVNATRTGAGGHIFFWGWARYRDIFTGTPEHISMFCLELLETRYLDLEHPAQGATYNMSWQLCGRNHNCSDDECDGEHYGNNQVWHGRR